MVISLYPFKGKDTSFFSFYLVLTGQQRLCAVNSLREYGQWRCDISFNVADVDGIIEKYTGK
jgi:hypothetical protein